MPNKSENVSQTQNSSCKVCVGGEYLYEGYQVEVLEIVYYPNLGSVCAIRGKGNGNGLWLEWAPVERLYPIE